MPLPRVPLGRLNFLVSYGYLIAEVVAVMARIIVFSAMTSGIWFVAKRRSS